MSTRIIAHVDLDAFYASAEHARHPEWTEQIIVVGMFSGVTELSGAVASPDYAARKLGIKAGMPLTTVKTILNEKPHQLVPADRNYYRTVSDRIMSLLAEDTDEFEQTSIDEAFLELTSMNSVEKSKKNLIEKRSIVEKEYHLSLSIGIAPNKLTAKIASGHQKPNGLTIVTDPAAFLQTVSLKDIPRLGPVTRNKLKDHGWTTVEQVRKVSPEELEYLLGKAHGKHVYNSVRGNDNSLVSPRTQKQRGRLVSLKLPTSDATELKRAVHPLCEEIAATIRHHKQLAATLTVTFVQSDNSTITRSRTVKPTEKPNEFKTISDNLIDTFLSEEHSKIRRVGVAVSNFTEKKGTLLDFFST